MKKSIITFVVVAAMSLTGSTVFAKTVKCQVKSVDNSAVVMDCGSKAGKLSVGQQVKVKTAKKAIEGC